MPYIYPGYPAFLARAAGDAGIPADIDSLARMQAGLTRCSTLLSQVPDAADEARPEILAAARRHAESLRLALAAAELAIDDIAREFGLSPAEPDPNPRRTRKPKGE